MMTVKTITKLAAFACAGFASTAAHAEWFEVPIDIIIFANDDGSQQAAATSEVETIFDRMNTIRYGEHGIRLVTRNYTILQSTTHNQLADGIGAAKLYADGNTIGVDRDPWVLAAFFTTAQNGGGVAWGGGPAPYGISHSDLPTVNRINAAELIMAHEVGHNLGLAHLDQYPEGSGMHYNDPGNDNNRMWGGEYFRPWQADIMKSWNYGSVVPEPASAVLVSFALVGFVARRRRG